VIFTVNSSTGVLSQRTVVAPLTNKRPQAIAITPDGKFAYVADGVDGVEMFSINQTNGDLTRLGAQRVAAALGPVAITVDPTCKFVYAANLDSNSISSYAILTDGSLTPISGSPFSTG